MGFTPQRGDSQGRGAGRGGRGALCPLLGTVLRAPTRGRGVGTEAVRPHAAVPGSSVGGPVIAPCVSLRTTPKHGVRAKACAPESGGRGSPGPWPESALSPSSSPTVSEGTGTQSSENRFI